MWRLESHGSTHRHAFLTGIDPGLESLTMNRRNAISSLFPLVLVTFLCTTSQAKDAQTAKAEVVQEVAQPEPADDEFAACESIAPSMGCVSGGAFLRGSNDGPHDVRPQASIILDTFYIDKHEVTVAEYEACVGTGGCKKAKTNYTDYSRALQPKVGVSWFHAVQYCEAQGKHLPTEAQWEKAARGTDGRSYPWGDQEATCKEAVIMENGKRSCGEIKKGRHPWKGRTLEVGTRAPNQFGLFDMAGNSYEWVYDWYEPYDECGEKCLGKNPRGPCDGASPCSGQRRRAVRSGSWYWPASYARTFARRAHVPDNDPYHHFGFRCAASVEEIQAFKFSP
jgi:sulfatase modifying factor 1